jgi:putative addiction module component (TIGR02574 family)
VADLSEILKTVLSLDIEDRAAVAEKILDSLEDLSDAEADRVWAQEAQRRLEAYRAGLANVVPAEDVARKAEKLFR